MRASRILTGRPDRAVNSLAQLCEGQCLSFRPCVRHQGTSLTSSRSSERDEDLVRAPRPNSPPPKHNGAGGAPYAFGGGYRVGPVGHSVRSGR